MEWIWIKRLGELRGDSGRYKIVRILGGCGLVALWVERKFIAQFAKVEAAKRAAQLHLEEEA